MPAELALQKTHNHYKLQKFLSGSLLRKCLPCQARAGGEIPVAPIMLEKVYTGAILGWG